jgi:hypothetical protein
MFLTERIRQWYIDNDIPLTSYETIAMLNDAKDAVLKSVNMLIQQGESWTRRYTIWGIRGNYLDAQSAWEEGNYDEAKTYHQKIIDKVAEIPEPALLPLLGLVLLPALFRRAAI